MAVLDTEPRIVTQPPAAPPADRGRIPPRLPRGPAGDGDGDGHPDEGRHRLSNARLGMGMLLCGEGMFFGGLVVAFLRLRLGATVWPPTGQPRLPVGLTAVNTLVLLLSSYTMARALGAARAGDRRRLISRLGLTWGLGALFLAVQGVEWLRLVRFGLRMSSGVYGATFYTLIGAHGAHVLGAVTWLLVVLAREAAGRDRRGEPIALVCCSMYWHFVVALWPILYVLVYLA
jgi:cytochrome c oxidase subunit III